jgi:hypothetical protein
VDDPPLQAEHSPLTLDTAPANIAINSRMHMAILDIFMAFASLLFKPWS